MDVILNKKQKLFHQKIKKSIVVSLVVKIALYEIK